MNASKCTWENGRFLSLCLIPYGAVTGFPWPEGNWLTRASILIWWQNERTSSSLPNFERWIKMSSDAVCSWVKVCYRRDMILPSVVYPPRYHGVKPTASVCVSWQENKARWNHYKTLSELCFQIVFPWLRLTCYDVGWR